ncbi:AAEL003429-PA [Aedes aegypti]|uniref:AAEL003429-PA n=2 Tax=Aedes aegypti TaxID=7159 RepID=Q17FE5_AEDAE|nr:AAEL003429-PA [Aedes aegypti]
MSVLGLWILASLVGDCIGYVNVQQPAQYNVYQSQTYEHKWQPLQYKSYDYQHHDYQTYGNQHNSFKPYEYKPYDYQAYDYTSYYYKPNDYQPYYYRAYDYQPYTYQDVAYQPYDYQTYDYNTYEYEPYDHQSYDYQPSYYNSYYSYYPTTYKYPEPYKSVKQHHKPDLSYDEGQKFLQVYRLIRVIALFRIPPKTHKSLFDKLVERLTKQPLQDQLVELVRHVNGYEEVAKLEPGPHVMELDLFVDDAPRLLLAVQRALNALDLEEYEGRGCCGGHEELCVELRQLRDQANALTVTMVKKEKVKFEVKQALDTDILEDLDEEQESRLLEVERLNIDVGGVTGYEVVENPYGHGYSGGYQTSSPVEVEFGELASALKVQLKHYMAGQVPQIQEKSQEGPVQVLPIEEAATATTTSRITPITTENVKVPGFVKYHVSEGHQVAGISLPVVSVVPAATEESNKLYEENVWVHEDAVVQNLLDITQRFQQSTSTDKSGLVWPHSVPLWLVKNTESPKVPETDSKVVTNVPENTKQVAIDEAKLQLVSEGVDDSLANYDVFADLVEHEAEGLTPEAIVADVQTKHHHQQEQMLVMTTVNEETTSSSIVTEALTETVPSETPATPAPSDEKVQHSKNDGKLVEALDLNIGERIVTKARLGAEEETGQLASNTESTASITAVTEPQNTTEEVKKSWLGSFFGKGYLLPVGQTIDGVTEPAELVEPVIEEVNKIEESIAVAHENLLVNNSLEVVSDPNLQALESTTKRVNSVSAVFQSVASWLRKTPDQQNLDNEGDVAAETEARSLLDDDTESALIDEQKQYQQPIEQRSQGASNEGSTSQNLWDISELHEESARVESREGEIPLPITESDDLVLVQEEVSKLKDTDNLDDLELESRLLDLEESDTDVAALNGDGGIENSTDYKFPSDYQTELSGELTSASDSNTATNVVTKANITQENSQKEVMKSSNFEDTSSNATTTTKTSLTVSVTNGDANKSLLGSFTGSNNLLSEPQAVATNESVTKESNTWVHEDIAATTPSHDATSPSSQNVNEVHTERISSESPKEKSATLNTHVEEVQNIKSDDLELNAEERMISEPRLANEEVTTHTSLNAETTKNEESSKTWLGSLFGNLPIRQTLGGVIQPVEMVQSVKEDANKMDKSTALTQENGVDHNTLASDSDPSLQTPESPSKNTSSVSSLIHSVTSWLRKSPDQQELESKGLDIAKGSAGEARALPIDETEVQLVDEHANGFNSSTARNETKPSSESVAVNGHKVTKEAPDADTTSPNSIRNLESRDGEPSTAISESENRAFVKGEVLKVLSLLEDANGFTELKDQIHNQDVEQLVDGLNDAENGFKWTEMISALQKLVDEKQLESGERIRDVLEHWKEGEDGHIDDGYFDKTYGAHGNLEGRDLDDGTEETLKLMEENEELGIEADGDETAPSVTIDQKNETLKTPGNVSSEIHAKIGSSRTDDVDDQPESQRSTQNPLEDKTSSTQSLQQEDEVTEKLGKTTPQPFRAHESESLALD